jgi:hypothetical protein
MSISFTPTNPTAFQGDIASVEINNPDSSLIYQWKPYNRKYLDDSYVHSYGIIFNIVLYETSTYIVNGVDNTNNIVTTSNITITILEKPANILDNDILPYELYNLIINRDTKALTKSLIENKILAQKIIKFYYNQILTAYRFQWTDKNGISYKLPWYSYQLAVKTPNSGYYLLSFKNQWKLFQYINQNQIRNGGTKSNFAYLLNIVNSIYLEKPQKIYYIQQ